MDSGRVCEVLGRNEGVDGDEGVTEYELKAED